jgi:hypothetical protein
MKKFSIKVVNEKPRLIRDLMAYESEIELGNFNDISLMPINSWSLEDYQNQWKEGLERIKTHDSSCLIVTVQNMDTYPFIMLWDLHKVNDTIFFINRLLNSVIIEEFYPHLNLSQFNQKTCYDFIAHRIINEKGEEINDEEVKIRKLSVLLSAIVEFTEGKNI